MQVVNLDSKAEYDSKKEIEKYEKEITAINCNIQICMAETEETYNNCQSIKQ